MLWLGPEFVRNGAVAMQMAALALLIGALKTVPTTALQAANGPNMSSVLRIFELPFYLGTTWLFIHFGGIVGAALARLTREMVETGVFIFLAHRLPPATANDRRHEKMMVGTSVMGLHMVGA